MWHRFVIDELARRPPHTQTHYHLCQPNYIIARRYTGRPIGNNSLENDPLYSSSLPVARSLLHGMFALKCGESALLQWKAGAEASSSSSRVRRASNFYPWAGKRGLPPKRAQFYAWSGKRATVPRYCTSSAEPSLSMDGANRLVGVVTCGLLTRPPPQPSSSLAD